MRELLQKILYAMARATLRRHKPQVVAVTGSVGKTTTKSAISVVLQKKFRVRENIKSYNNEIGVPLTILGFESPGASLFGWLSLFFSWVRQMIGGADYPQILVLEMGADKPGDISYLTSLAPPDIGVLTAIGSVHLERFGTIEAVAAEKRKLIENIRVDGTAILNADDDLVRATTIAPAKKVLTYGLSDDAVVRASDIDWNFARGEKDIRGGTSFKVTFGGSSVPVHLQGSVGLPAVSAALGAIAVGAAMGLNLVEISQALSEVVPTPGRLSLLPGINQSIIIDDSYNSSSRAVMAALDVLDSAPREHGSRHIVVLGDMRELGDETERAHVDVGNNVAERNIDLLVTVGENSRLIARAARERGFAPENIFSFSLAEQAGELLRERIKPGDVILFKGSQNFIRLERAVKMIMAEPDAAARLLVRQGAQWEHKP